MKPPIVKPEYRQKRLRLVFEVNTELPEMTIKEYIAMTLEKYGDVRCTEITEEKEEKP